jgi:MFS transporter, DHA2 family, multidrug resistance protein
MSHNRGELLRITGLYLLIVPFLNALNATGYENAQIQGHFGVSTTEFMYMNLIPVFALIAGLPLSTELAKQFRLKSMMYVVILVLIILNTSSAFVPSFYLFILCRSLLAFFSILGVFAAIVPIMMRYNPTFNMAILYGIIQFIIQGSSHLYKFLGAHFANIYDWRTSIMMVNINFILCLLLTFIFIRKDTAPFKQPFRFDFRGWLILGLFFVPILFLTAEGQLREWFSDRGIRIAAAFLLIITALYLLHIKTKSQPLLDPKVFRYRNVVIGTLFFFLIGILNSTGSVILGFMSAILGFDDMYQARTHLWIFFGVCISVPVCTYMLYRRVYLRIVTIAGFLAFGLYHLLMYYRFYPGITIKDFTFPLILKGIGIGSLYVVSSLYISEKVPKQLGTSRMMSGILARNVLAIILGSAILSSCIAKLTLHHATSISGQITLLNPQAVKEFNKVKSLSQAMGLKPSRAERAADNTLRGDVNETAKMLAYKDIYLAMAVFSFLPILLILLLRFGNRPVGSIEVEPIPI